MNTLMNVMVASSAVMCIVFAVFLSIMLVVLSVMAIYQIM